MIDRYPLHMYCYETVNSLYSFENFVLLPLRQVKSQLHIVLCKESPYNVINVLDPFSVIL